MGQRIQKLVASSPIAPFYGFLEPRCLCVNAYRLLDPLRRSELFPGEDGDSLEWERCYQELDARLRPVLQSAPWTFVSLRFDRADCTTVHLATTGPGCDRAVKEWT